MQNWICHHFCFHMVHHVASSFLHRLFYQEFQIFYFKWLCKCFSPLK
uniref:Uncharacterized protein n=1 Tax=Rhizophora mucronata TaxID=61149 RepID=A0A2P2R210_RHIMU